MKTKFKLCALIFALLCMAIIFMPNQVFATGVTEVANLDELQTALTDGNVTEIQLNNMITIDENITIEGNNKTITTSASKAFEVHGGTVNFNNVTIVNSAQKGRCIDVRDGDVILTLTGVTLKATDSSNNQTLNVGGSFAGPATINLNESTILAGKAGYGIITFNPVNLTINNSDITGYSALYMKGQVNSEGSAGSIVTVNASTLTGENNYEITGSNSFATVCLEDTDINISIDNSNVLAIGEGSALELLFSESSSLTNSEKGNTISIFGNSVLTAQEYLGRIVNSNTKIVLNEGVSSNIEIPEEVLPVGAVAKQENGKYVVYVPHDIEVSQELEGGTVEVDKTSAIAGETITITVTKNDGYELKSLKVYSVDDTELEVTNGTFIMPNLGAIVVAEFEEIETEDPEQPTEPEQPEEPEEETKGDVDFVVSDGLANESIKETLGSSLKADVELSQKVEAEIQKGEKITVSIKMEELKKENVYDGDKQTILQEISENQKIHQYFDISVAVETSQEHIGYLTELTEKVKLSIEIPEELIVEGREFFIVKLHNGEVQKIEAVLNGTKIEFETQHFSLFALAYEDVDNTISVPAEQEPEQEPESDEKDDTPKTGVINIPVYVWITIAGMAVVGILTTKKSSKHSK